MTNTRTVLIRAALHRAAEAADVARVELDRAIRIAAEGTPMHIQGLAEAQAASRAVVSGVDAVGQVDQLQQV